MRVMLVEIGNVVGMVGLLITLVSFRVGHGRRLHDLEPGLVEAFQRSRGWVRRAVLRRKPVTATARGRATGTFTVSGSAHGVSWAVLLPGDDIAVRVDKLRRNFDRLREQQEQQRIQARELTSILADVRKSVDQINADISAKEQADREASIRADRWEVRGLVTALIGAAIALLGSLTGW
jgi:hypothetical protein